MSSHIAPSLAKPVAIVGSKLVSKLPTLLEIASVLTTDNAEKAVKLVSWTPAAIVAYKAIQPLLPEAAAAHVQGLNFRHNPYIFRISRMIHMPKLIECSAAAGSFIIYNALPGQAKNHMVELSGLCLIIVTGIPMTIQGLRKRLSRRATYYTLGLMATLAFVLVSLLMINSMPKSPVPFPIREPNLSMRNLARICRWIMPTPKPQPQATLWDSLMALVSSRPAVPAPTLSTIDQVRISVATWLGRDLPAPAPTASLFNRLVLGSAYRWVTAFRPQQTASIWTMGLLLGVPAVFFLLVRSFWVRGARRQHLLVAAFAITLLPAPVWAYLPTGIATTDLLQLFVVPASSLFLFAAFPELGL